MTSFEDTIAKSKELDRFLAAEGDSKMSNIGGKFAGRLSDVMTGIQKAMDDVHKDITDAAVELHTEVAKGKHAAKAIRAEAAKVRTAMTEIMGNATEGENVEGDGQ